MDHAAQRDRLTAIDAAGSPGLFCPLGFTDEDRHLLDTGMVYVPLNPFRPFGPADRLKLTTDGRRWLRDNPAPPPPPPAPAPQPDPEPDPDPEPEPIPSPAPPPTDGKPAGSSDLPADHLPADPAPPSDAPPETEAHKAFRRRVEAAVGMHVSMAELAKQLVPLAEEARANGTLGGPGRVVLAMSKRNVRKWAQHPTQYGLDGVDE
jgi:hypothetical protein